jgi:hypothetical protein
MFCNLCHEIGEGEVFPPAIVVQYIYLSKGVMFISVQTCIFLDVVEEILYLFRDFTNIGGC